MRNLQPVIRVFLLGASLSGFAYADTFDRGLPNSINVNGGPATRSNEAWLTGFSTGLPSYQLVGDDFSFGFNGNVNSITVFEVANNTVGGPSSLPTDEFSSITLYEGSAADAATIGISAVSSTYTSAQVFYQPGNVNFIDQSGNEFSIYALTFSGLNLPVTAGTLYDFALDASANPGGCADSPFGDPCFLALHASNAALSGTRQDGADGQFINFTLSGGLANFQGFCDGACQASTAGVDLMAATDIDIQITATPEPTTWITMITMLGLVVFVRKRGRNRLQA